MKRRILSLFLALTMIISMIPTTAFATEVETVPVAGITLDQSELSLEKGDTATLTATVAPENATDKTVTWTSSDEATATVAEGLVTAVAAGTATITATTMDGNFAATCAVTISEPVVEEEANEPVIVESSGETESEPVEALPVVEEEADEPVTVESSGETESEPVEALPFTVKVGNAEWEGRATDKKVTISGTEYPFYEVKVPTGTSQRVNLTVTFTDSTLTNMRLYRISNGNLEYRYSTLVYVDGSFYVVAADASQNLTANSIVIGFVTEAQWDPVKTVNDLIAAISGNVTISDRETIEKAVEGYNSLTDAQKEQVTEYAKLQAAEETLNNLLIEEAKSLINAIGTVEATKESVEKIVAAREFYDALSEAQQGEVSNKEDLTAAETAIKALNPIIVQDVGEDQEFTLPEDTSVHLKVNVNSDYANRNSFTAEWFKNTSESTENAISLGTVSGGSVLGSNDVAFSYKTPTTTVVGTTYYYCVVTYTEEDTVKTKQSDYVAITVNKTEKDAFGIIEGEEPIGKVNVSIEDNIAKRTDITNMMGETMEDPGPAGTLLSQKSIALYPSDTMMTVIARACLLNGLTQEGAESGYIETIGNDTVSRSEFDRGAESGWMGTLNGWFTTAGFNYYTVANGGLQSGDTIKLMYTVTGLGKDIGCDRDNTDRRLASLKVSNLALQNAFDSDVHEYYAWWEGQEYRDTTKIAIQASAKSSNYMMRIFADGVEYRPVNNAMVQIPVTKNTEIKIYLSSTAGGEVEQEAKEAAYTIKTINAGQSLLTTDSVTLIPINEEGTEQEAITASYSNVFGNPAKFSANQYYSTNAAKNSEKMKVQLHNLPEGATAIIKSIITGEEKAFDEDYKVEIDDSVKYPGTYQYRIIVTSGETEEAYLLSYTKNANSLTRMTLKGDQTFAETINGELEGSYFQLDADGKETGETGISNIVYDYNMYLGMTQTSLTIGGTYSWNMGFGGISSGYTLTFNVNGEKVNEYTNVSELNTYLQENPLVISQEQTNLQLVFDYPDDSTYDDVTYNIHIYRENITAKDFEAMVDALPAKDDIQYVRDKSQIESLKKMYDEQLAAQVKEALSEETVAKLNAAVAKIEQLEKDGKEQISELVALVEKFKETITGETEITSELYDEYNTVVKEAYAKYQALNDWVLDEFNSNYTAERSALQTAYKLMNRYSISVKGSNGVVTDYEDDFMVSSNAYNLTLGAEEDAYEIVFRDFITSGERVESCLPYNTPGKLVYKIADESIVTIKEVKSTYVDKGLGGGGEYTDLLYYLIPLKEGTTTLNVTLTDEEGIYYGQIPEIIIHVNTADESAIADLDEKLTNIHSLERTTKYDTWYYWEGEEGAPFTFKVNGENAKVKVLDYNGEGSTEYDVAKDGTVTVLLKDGYNPIEVTADYEGKTVTQVYGLKGKVIKYTIENKYRPGEELRQGDTAVIKIAGLSRPVNKILRIYNPWGLFWTFTTDDLPGQGDLRADVNSGQYNMGYMEVLLTGSGTITLENGHIEESILGSALYSEAGQGNTGGIAAQGSYQFSVIPNISFEVEKNDEYKLEYSLKPEVSGNTTVKAGDKVTIKIPNLPVEEITEAFPLVTTNTFTRLVNVQTFMYTNIPGLSKIESVLIENAGVDVDAETLLASLRTITFTVPENTPDGTYRIWGGYVRADHGDKAYTVNTDYMYVMEMDELSITVQHESITVQHECKWDKGTITKAPTCMAAGEKTYTCACGETTKETIPATGHRMGQWTVSSEATVFKAEVQKRTCTVSGCGHSETRNVGSPLKATIKLNVTSLKLKVKQSTTKLKVTGLAKGDSVKSWKSSNTKIFTVTQKGKITAKKKTGTAKLTITLASGLKKTIKVKVQKGTVKTTSIKGLSKKMTLKKGKSITLKPELKPITSQQKITYSSSNKKIVTVNKNGKLTAKKAGTAKITVKSGSKKYVIKVTVPKTKTTEITNVKSKITLKKGKTYTLKAKLTPKNSDYKLTYKSSNKKVATVTSKGKIKAVKKGTAVITVKSGSVSVKCKVTVK